MNESARGGKVPQSPLRSSSGDDRFEPWETNHRNRFRNTPNKNKKRPRARIKRSSKSRPQRNRRKNNLRGVQNPYNHWIGTFNAFASAADS